MCYLKDRAAKEERKKMKKLKAKAQAPASQDYEKDDEMNGEKVI